MPRRVLSEAEFNAVRNQVLQSLPDNWDEATFNRNIGMEMDKAIAEAEHSTAPVEGSATGRFVSNAAEMLNPVTMAKGIYGAVRHPIDTVTNIAGQQADQAR